VGLGLRCWVIPLLLICRYCYDVTLPLYHTPLPLSYISLPQPLNLTPLQPLQLPQDLLIHHPQLPQQPFQPSTFPLTLPLLQLSYMLL
jgi:hypothetical protein